MRAACSCLLGLQLLEIGNFDVLDDGEEFLFAVLVGVPLPGDPDADLAGNVADAGSPHHSVKEGVDVHVLQGQTNMRNTEVLSKKKTWRVHQWKTGNRKSAYLGVHLLLSESADVPDSTGSSLFELDSLESLVEVQSVVTARGLKFFFHHLN